jgi:hypothetical protein
MEVSMRQAWVRGAPTVVHEASAGQQTILSSQRCGWGVVVWNMWQQFWPNACVWIHTSIAAPDNVLGHRRQHGRRPLTALRSPHMARSHGIRIRFQGGGTLKFFSLWLLLTEVATLVVIFYVIERTANWMLM